MSAVITNATATHDTIKATAENPAHNTNVLVDAAAETWYDELAVNVAGSLKGENPMRKPEPKICALYERLSREDGDVHEQSNSNSIVTQKQLLADYAKSQGFKNVRHYTDDGTSGVRFEREAWQELIADVEAGKVAQVLCKDMSRLGREHVQVGLYMELFRKAGVRFIAVTNNIDSAYPETLEFAPFVNLLNEFYAKDISRKIMAAKRSNGRNGKYVSSIAPYGYRKSETDKGVWEVDPEAAEVVKRIFGMTIEGYGVTAIANRLRKDKVYSPGYYMALRGTGTCKNKEWTDPYLWQGNMVDMIITRMEYKGCMVNLKTQKQSFKDKRSKQMPREDWLVFEGRHEAVVDEATWQSANDIREKKRRSKPDSLGEPSPLTGLLYCADCKSKMHHNRGIYKPSGNAKNYYLCKESKKGSGYCSGHRINGDVVEGLVLETLKMVSGYAAANEKEFTRQINEMYSAQQADNAKARRRKLKTGQSRHAELDKLIQRIYEDMVAQKITDKRFEVLSARYEQEQAELEQLIAGITAELGSYDDSVDRAAKFLELTKRYKEFNELTPVMLNIFVDRIEVHERADRRAIVTTQKVDVFLNFIGTYSPPIDEATEAQSPEAVAAHEKRMAKLMYQREYKKRREANGGKPLGHFEGKRPDGRTPEEIAEAEAEKKQRLREYHAKWYQDNKERMKAEQAEKRAAMTPEEIAEANAKRAENRREYERGYRERNRDKMNGYAREYRKNKREQNSLQQQAKHEQTA
jgi:DNA invertase Pin-like site-specific DNA recombinase